MNNLSEYLNFESLSQAGKFWARIDAFIYLANAVLQKKAAPMSHTPRPLPFFEKEKIIAPLAQTARFAARLPR